MLRHRVDAHQRLPRRAHRRVDVGPALERDRCDRRSDCVLLGRGCDRRHPGREVAESEHAHERARCEDLEAPEDRRRGELHLPHAEHRVGSVHDVHECHRCGRRSLVLRESHRERPLEVVPPGRLRAEPRGTPCEQERPALARHPPGEAAPIFRGPPGDIGARHDRRTAGCEGRGPGRRTGGAALGRERLRDRVGMEPGHDRGRRRTDDHPRFDGVVSRPRAPVDLDRVADDPRAGARARRSGRRAASRLQEPRTIPRRSIRRRPATRSWQRSCSRSRAWRRPRIPRAPRGAPTPPTSDTLTRRGRGEDRKDADALRGERLRELGGIARGRVRTVGEEEDVLRARGRRERSGRATSAPRSVPSSSGSVLDAASSWRAARPRGAQRRAFRARRGARAAGWTSDRPRRRTDRSGSSSSATGSAAADDGERARQHRARALRRSCGCVRRGRRVADAGRAMARAPGARGRSDGRRRSPSRPQSGATKSSTTSTATATSAASAGQPARRLARPRWAEALRRRGRSVRGRIRAHGEEPRTRGLGEAVHPDREPRLAQRDEGTGLVEPFDDRGGVARELDRRAFRQRIGKRRHRLRARPDERLVEELREGRRERQVRAQQIEAEDDSTGRTVVGDDDRPFGRAREHGPTRRHGEHARRLDLE